MSKKIVLAMIEDEGLYERVRAALPANAEILVATTVESVLAIAAENRPHLVLIERDESADAESLCRRVRELYYQIPPQFIVLSEELEGAELALPAGFDDALLAGASLEEFHLALRAAFFRGARIEALFRERNFYRSAVRREESLSSHLLDEHLALKETLLAITEAKRSLETANRRLERAASRDALSGLLNRASLFDRLALELRRAEAEGSVLSGILVDLDHFKLINDSFGHLVGDEVIRELGRRLMAHLRTGDSAGRYGGEEFFIVLPGADLARARVTAERIRESIIGAPFGGGDLELKVAASFGVAERRSGESVEGWVERADRAMYQAKQSGRNKVCADED